MNRGFLPVVALALAAACTGTGPSADGDAHAVDGADDAAAAPSGPFSPSCPESTGGTGHFAKTLTVNNAAQLAGGTLGRPDLGQALLRRPVTVTTVGSADPFVIGAAYALRDSADTGDASVMIGMTITGANTRCFIVANNIRWLDATGAELAVDDRAYLTGSVGRVLTTYTDTCLGPGDTGYLISAYPKVTGKVDTFANLHAIELTLDPGESAVVAPGNLIPVAYRGCGESRLFEVALESRGPAPVAFWSDSVGRYVLADEQGPLDWGFLGPRSGLGVQNSGTGMLVGGNTFYRGTATRLEAYLSFEDPTRFASRSLPTRLETLQEEVRADRQRLWRKAVLHAGYLTSAPPAPLR